MRKSRPELQNNRGELLTRPTFQAAAAEYPLAQDLEQHVTCSPLILNSRGPTQRNYLNGCQVAENRSCALDVVCHSMCALLRDRGDFFFIVSTNTILKCPYNVLMWCFHKCSSFCIAEQKSFLHLSNHLFQLISLEHESFQDT